MAALQISVALLEKYNYPVPRYTSYPTAPHFHPRFTANDYARHAALGTADQPISLYLHIPFCDTACFYCGCNKIITNNRRHSDEYIVALFREIALQGALFDRQRPVTQLHFGGGTPSFIGLDNLARTLNELQKHFNLDMQRPGEYSIELDPRRLEGHFLRELRQIGFNRVSFGIQDLDPTVQLAINRIQPAPLVEQTIKTAKNEQFQSVSVDILYGLPYQTLKSVTQTVQSLIQYDVDRLSVFSYAHLPERFKLQRRFDPHSLPDALAKWDLWQAIREPLIAAGYRFVGMDHFAKPDDELFRAQQAGNLSRNFQGYSTHAHCDLIGLGASAIGSVGRCYAQNHREVTDYNAALQAGKLPLFQGLELTDDDIERRHFITHLMCYDQLDWADPRWPNLQFADYEKALEPFVADGLIEVSSQQLQLRPMGRLLVRNLAAVFDNYLPKSQARHAQAI